MKTKTEIENKSEKVNTEKNKMKIMKRSINIRRVNLTFAGCGFLNIYYNGVWICLKHYAPYLLLGNMSGASAGALTACCLICDLSPEEVTRCILEITCKARCYILGAFNPFFETKQLLMEYFYKILPKDAYIRANGKLYISLTRASDKRNVIISHFDSNEELMETLIASTFIPIFSGLTLPKFRGVKYIDGGFTNQFPVLNENTLTVSPYDAISDIGPRDNVVTPYFGYVNFSNMFMDLSINNMRKLIHSVFPANIQSLATLCKQGFIDTLKFLDRYNLLRCDKCLSKLLISENQTDEKRKNDDEKCAACEQRRQEILAANFPKNIQKIFDKAIENNMEIINFLYTNIKLLFFIVNVSPIKITYIIIRRIITIINCLISNFM